MKICFIGLEIIPQKNLTFYGGLQNNVIRISKGLQKLGNYEISIFTSDVNRRLIHPLKTPWAEIYPIKISFPYSSIFFGMEFFLKIIKKSIKYCNKSEFNILHIHSAYPFFGVLSKFIDIPSIMTLYSPFLSGLGGRGWFFKKISHYSMNNFYLSGVDHFIALSKNVKFDLIKSGIPDKRINVIPPIVDDVFKPEVDKKIMKRKLHIDDEDPILLYCGNWTPWKGVDVLINSLKKVKKYFNNVKLILAFGEPINWQSDMKRKIDNQIMDLNLESNIIQIGFIDNIEELMAASDIFIAPFKDTREVADIPLSIIEAMACGKTIIATKVGGIVEFISHNKNGYLVEPGRDEELADAIINLLSNIPLKNSIGENALKYSHKTFGLTEVSKKIEEIYKKMY